MGRDEKDVLVLCRRLACKLDAESEMPLYRQLSDRLQELIADLEFMPGELMPSTRALASALGISRKTVCRCYEDLLSRGFIKSQSGVGTFVGFGTLSPENTKDSTPSSDRAVGRRLTKYAETLMACAIEPSNQGDLPELHFGAPPVSELPIKAWRQVLLAQLRNSDLTQFYYDTEPFGYLPLRTAIASYLMRSRALRCKPEQIVVFSHALSPLRLFAQLVIEAGDSVVVENPGFPFARKVFESLGAKLIPVPVDQDGMCVDELDRIDETVRVIYVTPSHQDPTGAMMSLARRKQLLDWAKAKNCLILEDDYDCEFRYTGSTLPALMALADGENVVYVGDMWKTLFPLINVGYLVLPANLVDVFSRAQSSGWTKASTSLPFFDQLAITAFMNEGFFERHLRKTKATYASRYRNFVLGITRFFGGVVEYAKDSGGMQVLIRFKIPASAVEILKTAKDAGLSLIPTQPYYVDGGVEKEFLLAFVMLDESEMMVRLERWAACLKG
ncbi:MAG: PLP-dependent aminotransferase family protein [Candidatus Melainabacteria bacterium]|nr:PLP-dependent aminotransferase family protein [Candidatus Melainabacteria bacterium]